MTNSARHQPAGRWRASFVALALCICAWTRPGLANAASPGALWRVVHDLCVPMHRLTRLPTPCLSVDSGRRTAVVPNPRSATEVLLVPTRRIIGIEDARLQAPGAPNYWEDAWNARRYVARGAGRLELADADVAMAVNAVAGRSQNQLHIHVDCVRPEVKTALAGAAPRLGAHWRRMKLQGGDWLARRLVGDSPAPDPFRLLAEEIPGAADELGAWTLVVAGLDPAEGAPGFALLARRTEAGFAGHGEVLLDKTCAVLGGG